LTRPDRKHSTSLSRFRGHGDTQLSRLHDKASDLLLAFGAFEEFVVLAPAQLLSGAEANASPRRPS